MQIITNFHDRANLPASAVKHPFFVLCHLLFKDFAGTEINQPFFFLTGIKPGNLIKSDCGHACRRILFHAQFELWWAIPALQHTLSAVKSVIAFPNPDTAPVGHIIKRASDISKALFSLGSNFKIIEHPDCFY